MHGSGEQDLTKILAFYTSVSGLCPHYVVDYAGKIYRIADEGSVAWHCKIDDAEARLYRMGYGEWSQWIWNDGNPKHLGQEFPGYRNWRDTWFMRGLQSPLDLITQDKPNYRSIGIELQSPTDDMKVAGIYTIAQYGALAELIKGISVRQRIPIGRERVLTHSDCSPMRRCTNRGPYDPGLAFDFNRLWDLLS